MNGKVLPVKVSELQYGTTTRMVNVLTCFKYKINGNIYIIYCDTDTKYNVVYYGSGHIRQGVALCMPIRDITTEEEIIKEYIFKVTSNEALDNFEIISLNEAQAIEIIGSTKLELKPEILASLIDNLMPKLEVKPEVKEKKIKKEQVVVSVKKKKKSKSILLGVIIAGILLGGVYYLLGMFQQDTILTSITCTKSYQHKEINANAEETNKYSFNVNDTLEFIDTTIVYQFEESTYQDFIMKGTYYKYMPTSGGSWDKDDENFTFKVVTKEIVDTSYDKPKAYEEVLSFYKADGFVCTETIEE